MIMKLIKHVAEDDKLRDSLNELVTQVNDKDLANYILEELMLYPGLVSTGFDISDRGLDISILLCNLSKYTHNSCFRGLNISILLCNLSKYTH